MILELMVAAPACRLSTGGSALKTSTDAVQSRRSIVLAGTMNWLGKGMDTAAARKLRACVFLLEDDRGKTLPESQGHAR